MSSSALERGITCGSSGPSSDTSGVGETWASSGRGVDRVGLPLGSMGSLGELGVALSGVKPAGPDLGRGMAPCCRGLRGVACASGMTFSSSALAPASSSRSGRPSPAGAVVGGPSSPGGPLAAGCSVAITSSASPSMSSVTLLAWTFTGAGGPRAAAAVGLGRAAGPWVARMEDGGGSPPPRAAGGSPTPAWTSPPRASAASASSSPSGSSYCRSGSPSSASERFPWQPGSW